jgi:hypothetical protein
MNLSDTAEMAVSCWRAASSTVWGCDLNVQFISSPTETLPFGVALPSPGCLGDKENTGAAGFFSSHVK